VNETDAVYLRNDVDGPWLVTNGTVEQNGTKNMMGNVWEWLESTYGGEAYDLGNSPQQMAFHGGDWFLNQQLGTDFLISSKRASDDRGGSYNIGMRIVAIPEPSPTMLILFISGLGLFIRRKFMV